MSATEEKKRKPKQRFTLRDVAALADVSLKTASRVLNNEPNVQIDKIEAVRKAMERLSYRPNEIARGLKGRRSGVIGIVVPVLSHQFVAAYVETFHHAALKSGKSIMLMVSDGVVEAEHYHVQSLLRRQVEGLVVLPAGNTITAEMAEEIGDTPAVVIDLPSLVRSIPSVMIANRKSAREAIEHLLEGGHRNIAVVGAKPEMYTIMERVAGARLALKDAGLPLRELVTQTEAELTPESILALFEQHPRRPMAILTLNSFASEQVLQAIGAAGLRIPEDVALVGFDDFRMAQAIAGGITVVSQPIKEMAEHALQLLLEQQAGKAVKERLILQAPLIIRNSSRYVGNL